MGSCAAPSAKGDDKFITTDYLQQCLTIHWLPGPIPGCSRCWSGHPDSGISSKRWHWC
uniref:hypothetical protein n=1 Tax=Klebsiella pneumoniae TaxID=573 RepID=UPI001E4CEE20|nr:hypothetical protein [Klebsiella pneumoniae]